MAAVVSAAPTMVTNITGIFDHHARVEFLEGISNGGSDDFPFKQRRWLLSHTKSSKLLRSNYGREQIDEQQQRNDADKQVSHNAATMRSNQPVS